MLRQYSWKYFFCGLFALLIIGLSSLIYVKNVSVTLSPADIATLESISLRKPAQTLTFDQEISLIRLAQKKIFKLAPLGEAIPNDQPREITDLLKYGSGLCYDRSRSLDKTFSYLGFKSRHVFLLFKGNRSFFSAIFQKYQGSHAVTEVKTSRGWMFVDSNTPWIAITRSGEVVNADDVWKRFDEFDNPPEYLKANWWAIRGLYSRGGRKYSPYIPFPELNWPTFLNWAIHG